MYLVPKTATANRVVRKSGSKIEKTVFEFYVFIYNFYDMAS